MTRKHYNLLLKTINGIEYTKNNNYYVEQSLQFMNPLQFYQF